MALRAGYYGLKKSVVRKLMDLSESLIIKRLGAALSLTSAGELRIRNATNNQSGIVQPDGDTLVIENGLLQVREAGSVFLREELFTANARVTVAILNKNADDYDYLEILLRNDGSSDNQLSSSFIIPASRLAQIPYVSDSNVNPHLLLSYWGGIGFSLGYNSTNNALHMWGFNNAVYLEKVYGIKL